MRERDSDGERVTESESRRERDRETDDSCLDAEVRIYAAYKVTTKNRCTQIERDSSLIGTVISTINFLLSLKIFESHDIYIYIYI